LTIHKNHKFLNINSSSYGTFQFLLLDENDKKIRVYYFSEYYALDKGFHDTEIIKLDSDKKHSQKINQKLLGT
jgi:hypothetical protein